MPDVAPGWPPPALEVELSEADFKRLGRFIEEHCGIRMPPGKRVMLEGRLRKRLRVLGLSDFGEYFRLVSSGGDEAELVHMVDEVTTNKTDFFREGRHFEYLVDDVLPMLGCVPHGPKSDLRVWSAGCSTGEEPYTLAMVLSEVALRTSLHWEIAATDISTEVLAHARAATYGEDRVEPIPLPLRQKYLLRRRDGSGFVRIVPQLRDRIRFSRLNLLDRSYARLGTKDVIFCRNVFIYFEKPIQEAILNRFAEVLAPGGFVFLGHSETINGLDVPLVQVAPTVYRKVP